MFLGELVESIHSVTEGTSITDVFPSKRRQAGWRVKIFMSACVNSSRVNPRRGPTAERSNGCIHRLDEHAFTVKLGLRRYVSKRKVKRESLRGKHLLAGFCI